MNYYHIIYFVLFLCSFSSQSDAQESLNMDLFDLANTGDQRYSGSWVYVDTARNREYALLGASGGTAIFDITEQPIKELFFIRGPFSNWREITVLGDHAYVVTEGTGVGEGMQVIDLNFLPTAARLVTTYTTTFTTGHIIQRDIYSEAPYVYVNGACSSCGINILDVSTPESPRQVGLYNPGYYIHDCHVKGDFLYAAAFFEGTIDIVDISDKTRPVLIAQIEDPGGNTHSSWLTEDDQYLIISDELDGLPARIWNIADLENMFEVATYTANENSLTHNPYVRGDYAFFSHNTEGIRAVDIKDPRLPLEVGFYDTFDRPSGGFNGLWSACPYLPSGKIIGGDRDEGLFVWTFNNTVANRIYVTILDASTNTPVNGVDLTINEEQGKKLLSEQIGYATLEEQLDLSIIASGYEAVDTLVVLEEGEQLEVTIFLTPISVSNIDINQLTNKINAYPNPYRNSTTLDLSELPTANRIEVYDAAMNLYDNRMIQNKEPLLELKEQGQSSGVFYYMIYDKLDRLIATGKLLKIGK